MCQKGELKSDVKNDANDGVDEVDVGAGDDLVDAIVGVVLDV